MSELSETPFRVYRLDGRTSSPPRQEFLAAADDCSLGELLLDLHKRGLVTDEPGTSVGILYRPLDGEPGIWLVNPWARPAVVSGRLASATTTEEESDE